MTPEQEARIIRRCEHRDTDRTGLYVMVIFLLLSSCSMKNTVREAVREELKAQSLRDQIKPATPEAAP